MYIKVRKILVLTVIIGLLAGSLCGCGGKAESKRRTIGSITDVDSGSDRNANQPVLQLTIASNQTSQDNPYKAMRKRVCSKHVHNSGKQFTSNFDEW